MYILDMMDCTGYYRAEVIKDDNEYRFYFKFSKSLIVDGTENKETGTLGPFNSDTVPIVLFKSCIVEAYKYFFKADLTALLGQ